MYASVLLVESAKQIFVHIQDTKKKKRPHDSSKADFITFGKSFKSILLRFFLRSYLLT